MLKEGYSGCRTIGKYVKNMFLSDVTLDAVNDWAWQKVAETYVFDENLRRQLDPFVTQSIISWSLEAARRGIWDADAETLNKLSSTYIQTANQFGLTCNHHACANITFNE